MFIVKIIGMKHTIYDAHCHLFHKGHITRRILHSLLDLMSDLDTLVAREKSRTDIENAQKVKVASLIKRIINVINLLMSSSSKEVMLKLKKQYKGFDVIFVPLSYNVASCFQESYTQDISSFSSRKDHELLMTVRDNILTLLDKYMHRLEHYKIFNQLQSLHTRLDELISYRNNKEAELDSKDIFMFQVNQLQELKSMYPDHVYPFFYVDPRHSQTLTLARELVGKDKPFLGIKLYTPNGYSPLDPNLMDLYDFCQSNQIPITAHNSNSGFATFVKKLEIKGAFYFDGHVIEHSGWIEFDTDFFSGPGAAIVERAKKLNHPKLWEKVMLTFPELRLNLAHFGGEGKDWQEIVIQLMLKYPNLYTDLSCQTEQSMLQYIKKKFFPLAPHKFLYGSDYYLNMFFIDSFSQYLTNFFNVFTEAELEKMMYYNPGVFLFDRQQSYLS